MFEAEDFNDEGKVGLLLRPFSKMHRNPKTSYIA